MFLLSFGSCFLVQTPSFTSEEPSGLLIMRLKSNFFTKLSKHFTGLWGAILILSTTEESPMVPKSWKALDLSMFQVFHVLRGCLNIFKKKCFQMNDHWTVWIDNFLYSIISAMAFESWSIACFKLHFWNIACYILICFFRYYKRRYWL